MRRPALQLADLGLEGASRSAASNTIGERASLGAGARLRGRLVGVALPVRTAPALSSASERWSGAALSGPRPTSPTRRHAGRRRSAVARRQHLADARRRRRPRRPRRARAVAAVRRRRDARVDDGRRVSSRRQDVAPASRSASVASRRATTSAGWARRGGRRRGGARTASSCAGVRSESDQSRGTSFGVRKWNVGGTAGRRRGARAGPVVGTSAALGGFPGWGTSPSRSERVRRGAGPAWPAPGSSATSPCPRPRRASGRPRPPSSPPCRPAPARPAGRGQGLERGQHRRAGARRATVSSAGSSSAAVALTSAPRSARSSRSSGSGSARRTFIARSRSRQALTTTRCSQVVTAASPRKDPARRNAAIIPSWRPSAASSGLPIVRRATAHSRSRCRAKSSPKASASPSTCRPAARRRIARDARSSIP